MSKSSEETGRSAKKPKVTKKATAKQKAPAQKTANSAVTKGAAAKKMSTTEKAGGPKAAGQKQSVAKKSVAKKSAAKRVSRKAAQWILASERHQMIAEAAYLRAEAQGFASDQHEDWLMAEAEVDARLAKAGRKVID